jgi:hypothetical protein
METRKRVLGVEHPSTLTSMANLASTYSGQGRWKEAEELEVQVMETKKRVLGVEHPSTLTSMANLGLQVNADLKSLSNIATASARKAHLRNIQNNPPPESTFQWARGVGHDTNF